MTGSKLYTVQLIHTDRGLLSNNNCHHSIDLCATVNILSLIWPISYHPREAYLIQNDIYILRPHPSLLSPVHKGAAVCVCVNWHIFPFKVTAVRKYKKRRKCEIGRVGLLRRLNILGLVSFGENKHNRLERRQWRTKLGSFVKNMRQ